MDLEAYAAHTYFYLPELPAWLSELIGEGDFSTLLDLGCGDGTLLVALKGQGHLEGKAVWGVDGSAIRIERLRRHYPEVRAVVSDVTRVAEVASGSIDLLLSTQVIEHVADDGAMIQEMARLLAPGGRFYLSTVFKRWYGWYFYRCNGRWTLDPTHVREYRSDEELLPRLLEAGLEIRRQQKGLFAYPLSDFVFRRFPVGQDVYRARWLRRLRILKLPIIGYYNWEIVGRKRR